MSMAPRTSFQDDKIHVRRTEPVAADAFAELSVVALRNPAHTVDSIVIPSGAMGAIVRVWEAGTSYEVEFPDPLGALATVAHDDLVLVEAGP